MLTREQLLGSFRRRYDTVDTPVGALRIQNLTEGEKSDFEEGQLTADGKLNLRAVRAQRRKLIAAVLVDEAGNLLLNEEGDVARLKGVDSAVTSAAFDAATKHCGFSRDEIEELKKNYDAATDDASPTG